MSILSSPKLVDMIFINLLPAWPTAWEVFLATPATTGCIEITGRFARSSIIAVVCKTS
ncbi:hypothetical protein Hanom_Chr05g00417751 [Helianthus anomalus]